MGYSFHVKKTQSQFPEFLDSNFKVVSLSIAEN